MYGLGVTERVNRYLQSHVGVALFDAQKEEGDQVLTVGFNEGFTMGRDHTKGQNQFCRFHII